MGLNTNVMFAEGIKKLTTGIVDFDTHTIRGVLVKKSYANTTLTETAKDTHDFLNDVPTADRSKNSAFPALGTQDVTIDAGNDRVNYAGGTVSIQFTQVSNGTSCRGVVFFKSSSGTESECPILSYNHLDANITADGGTVTVTLNADGIFRASY